MAQFSRATLFEACNLLGNSLGYHGQVEDLFYRWELDDFAEQPAGAIHQRFRQLFRYLKDNPTATHDGRSLIDVVVEEAAKHASKRDDVFVRALERDGFTWDGRTLRRALRDVVDIGSKVSIFRGKNDLDVNARRLNRLLEHRARGFLNEGGIRLLLLSG